MTDIPILDKPIARLMELDQASVFAIADIAAERVRQIEVAGENWTPKHDDAHGAGILATAGACYAAHNGGPRPRGNPLNWPWHKDWWKPQSPRRNWVRGGALIVAELARHLRSAPKR